MDGSILSDPLFTKCSSVKFVQEYHKCLSYIHILDILTFYLVDNALWYILFSILLYYYPCYLTKKPEKYPIFSQSGLFFNIGEKYFLMLKKIGTMFFLSLMLSTIDFYTWHKINILFPHELDLLHRPPD